MSKFNTLCVFCGSRSGTEPAYGAAARALGAELGKRSIDLVYGGGGIGLMADVANAAVAAGSKVTGIIPEFLRAYEVGVVDGAEELVVGGMHQRKAKMFEMSDAFVILPGGLGTLDESMEIITWKQLQQHKKPIVFLNTDGYWEPLMGAIEQVVEKGFGHHKVRELFTMVDRVEDIFPAIANHIEPDAVVLTSHL